ncbi:hypothetical protein E2C01_044812 [Portunus trituberculatus]|uniref:Uncharacterized protein n=1 Tax=Portunus trituberculatus TaxID=210409 RepID=A0A5B7G064_PORTR|nr:hypothetical protein [Portunus trituberculatus]
MFYKIQSCPEACWNPGRGNKKKNNLWNFLRRGAAAGGAARRAPHSADVSTFLQTIEMFEMLRLLNIDTGDPYKEKLLVCY